MIKHHFLVALAFTSASLAAVHLGTFVWLTAFVYHHDIRGQVPAGITGMSVLFLAWVPLLILLIMAGRRRHRVIRYFLLGGLFGVPLAIVLASFYSSALIALVDYTLQKAVSVASFGAVLFATIAVWLYRRYLRRTSDNQALHATAAAPSS